MGNPMSHSTHGGFRLPLDLGADGSAKYERAAGPFAGPPPRMWTAFVFVAVGVG